MLGVPHEYAGSLRRLHWLSWLHHLRATLAAALICAAGPLKPMPAIHGLAGTVVDAMMAD